MTATPLRLTQYHPIIITISIAAIKLLIINTNFYATYRLNIHWDHNSRLLLSIDKLWFRAELDCYIELISLFKIITVVKNTINWM